MIRTKIWGILGAVLLSITSISTLTYAETAEVSTYALTDTITVTETDFDRRVVPDNYNTGSSGSLSKPSFSGTNTKISGVTFTKNSTGELVLYYGNNTSLYGTYRFSNIDFSQTGLFLYDASQFSKAVTLEFTNCKFSTVRVPFDGNSSNVNFVFSNCSFSTFIGSNASFDHCKFGGTFSDGLVPYQNIAVNNCYFSNFYNNDLAGAGLHSDGTQMYGHEDVMVKNVNYTNCRFEVPPVKTTNGADINSCIMLQMEYNNAEDVHFTDCIVNGGGYSIYAQAIKNAEKLTNVTFDNILVGNGNRYGVVMPGSPSGVTFNNFQGVDSLLVGSIWKCNGTTHVCVSNDSGRERKLRIITDRGISNYTIKACPTGEEIFNSITDASKLPVDMDIAIAGDCKYVICYDVTYAGMEKQIRFVNFTTNTVTVTKANTLVGKENSNPQTIISGSCGKNVFYTLTADGKLLLTGTGETYNYSSETVSPWYNYRDMIHEVIISDGITVLGNQLFIDCKSLSSVILNKSLIEIKPQVFFKCSMLTEITLPSSLKTIGYSAFDITLIRNVYYEGTKVQWNAISIDKGNTLLTSHITDTEVTLKPGIKKEGTCGTGVKYTLYDEGKLVISGNGEMDKYTSTNLPPYYNYREEISEIIIEGGVTYIGQQAFNKFTAIDHVVINEGVRNIGVQAFGYASEISMIELPVSLINVSNNAFIATRIDSVKYSGSKESWAAINVQTGNDTLKYATVVFSDQNQNSSDDLPSAEGNSVTLGKFVKSGPCGEHVSYTLYDSGYLVLSGNGMTNNYNSKTRQPFYTDRNSIKGIIVESGITLGTQIFNGLLNLERVILKEGVTSIGTQSFGYITKIESLELPLSLAQIRANAFAGTSIISVKYAGSKEKWNSISIESGNDSFLSANFTYNLEVKKKDISTLRIVLEQQNYTYTGNQIQPKVSVYSSTDQLKENTDYTVSYENNIQPGTGSVVVKGIGNYEGERKLNFIINAPVSEETPDIDDSEKGEETLPDEPVINPGTIPEVTGSIIQSGACGTSTTYSLYDSGYLVLSGTGATENYHSQKRPPYYIYRSSIKTIVVESGITEIGNQAFNGFPSLNRVVIKDGVTSIGNSTFGYSNSIDIVELPVSLKLINANAFAGTTINSILYSGSNEDWKTINILSGNDTLLKAASNLTIAKKTDINSLQITISGSEFEYTGDSIFPEITILNGKSSLVNGKDYTVQYNNNIEPGTGTIIINGIGDYEGEKTLLFCIKEPVVVDPVLSAGMCGSNTTYTLYKSGTLIIGGTGNTDNYFSAKRPPYYDYRDMITNVIIEGGVSVIGQQLFNGFTNISSVVIQSGVQQILTQGFGYSNPIHYVELPSSIKVIANNAFSGTGINTVVYKGTLEQWKTVSIGTGNDALVNITFN